MSGPDYRPGDRVRGAFDSGVVVRTDGSGPNAGELARHLRAVARRVATRPWTTSIETVLRELADALDPPAPQDPG